MTRTAIAGFTFDLLNEECRERLWDASPEEFGALYLQGVTPECFDEAVLRDWLRNAPSMKPMYASPEAIEELGGKSRGMPNLNLTEAQIDELIAYLTERK
jgi:cytochrome c oxidase subunit 2